MTAVLQPTIDYARNGHPVSELIAFYWGLSVPRLSQYPGFTEQFTIDGRAPQKGEVWKNPNLANTLEQIAREGRDAFYKGDIARTIGDYFAANEGFLSYEDLASHESEWVEPVSTNSRGYDLWELPPNGQGIAALQMLNLMEPYDIAAMGFGSADYIHLFTEAKKVAYEDRARFYADMQFADVPVDRLISKQYAAERGELIDMKRAARAYPHGDPAALRDGDTIYLSTADAQGNMVSLIQSNYRGMGSGMSAPGLGFIFQDRGELFSLDPEHPNRFEPGKRPFHTIIPAFVTRDGKPWLSFGVMGGGMQPQGHVQILVNMIDFGMNLQEAGDAPRIHHDGSSEPTGEVMEDGGELDLETGFDYEVIRELEGRGHRVEFARGPYGGYQAVMRDPESGMYFGASESRKDGQAAGY
jgi:gamma-glutamyltranspeptidase/glutathione hydrolase